MKFFKSLKTKITQIKPVNPVRRRLLGGGFLAGGLVALTASGSARAQSHDNHSTPEGSATAPKDPAAQEKMRMQHGGMTTVGEVDHARNGFHPVEMLTDWDRGVASTLPDGRTLREFEITAEDKEIEIAPGIFFPAWTYNGRVPGPTLRVTEGDVVRIRFTNNSSMPHTMHFHGIHAARMDGVPGAGEAMPGEEFTYEFDAKPFGCHLYHCHSFPLKRHMQKGLYGAFIVDPDPEKHRDNPADYAVARSRLLGTPENDHWQEFIMVMNGFDTNFDEENEIYAVNSIAHAYSNEPIRVDKARPIRVYLVNVTEFDPINSFHLHGNFFDYYDHGTTLSPTLRIVDTVMQCQAQRGIIEISFAEHENGNYMFHAHQAEFAELGWMSLFQVEGEDA
ncbi:multicopper oxidase domain-containing protein [Kiloniella laminariae]|uniref:Copper-containing nitrite reductase n=1 Tax=Kiloniella laminariae TaxID=454162 RepID=A0ABT4LF17_9PROT|nr:multicopper oxidase domain-containing protein [Kiloniella laminariae]MCZ4279703.1 multicopper oxidase domain-containing protein [Kiloniella laminariae]